jgi:predicted neutral ceramidase superfamily lipid hydrolase
MAYTPSNWYWSVGDGPPNTVYSSAAAAYVATTDATYATWSAVPGNRATPIPLASLLQAVLVAIFPSGQAGVNPTGLAASFDAELANLLSAGFQYNFSAYSTDAGIAVSTLTLNGTAGVMTIQMDANSQINWLGLTAEAQLAVATGNTTTTFPIRVLENLNIVIPATDVVMILSAAATWKTRNIFINAGLKDQLVALTGTTAAQIAAMAAIVWPVTPSP